MIVAAFIIIYHPLLDAFGGNIHCNMDNAVFAPVRGQDTEFYGVERISGIAACHICQKIKRILINLSMKTAHALLCIFHSSSQKDFYIFFFQRFQLKDAGSGNQSTVYLKIRILRSRSDQDHGPILHKGEKVILLSFVEPVDLVDKEDRLPAVHPLQIFCFLYDLFHIFFPGYCRIDLLKLRTCRIGDHLCQSRLSCSRRPVEDDRTEFVRLDRPVKQLIFSYDMLLSHHFIQRRRTHSRCQRRFFFLICLSHIIKQIHDYIFLSLLCSGQLPDDLSCDHKSCHRRNK